MRCSDPLPFQCLTRYPRSCQNVQFVDVDYVELMTKKREIIEQTDSLCQLLTNLRVSTTGETITIRSDEYVAVGCDLRDAEKLQRALAEEFDLENCLVLCTAEVSITYMDVQAADALIRWAATLRNGKSSIDLLRRVRPNSISSVLSSGTISTRWTRTPFCESNDPTF